MIEVGIRYTKEKKTTEKGKGEGKTTKDGSGESRWSRNERRKENVVEIREMEIRRNREGESIGSREKKGGQYWRKE